MDPSSSCPQNPSGELHTINSSLELPTTVSSCATVEELETKFETLSDKNITPIITQQQEESTITIDIDDESDNHQMHKQNSENNLYSSSSTNNSILNMIEDSNINSDDLLEINRRNTINIVPTHFVHKRGSQELPELVSPYRKIATTNNLKAALKNNASSSSSQKLNKSGNSASYSKFESKSSADAYKSLQILTNNQQNSQISSPNNSESFAKYKYALENDDFSQIDFGLEVNSAQTSASEITFPVTNKQNAFYGNAQNNANGNYFFNGQHNTASVDETIMRKNSVIDDSVSDNGELEISKHYELYLICIGDLDNCLVHKMLKTAGGQMYISNRQVSFILRNNNEKVTCTFNFYSQFNWYLMDFLKDEAKDCHGLLFMFNITHSEGWNELKQTISKKYVDVQDFVKPSIVLGTYSHSNRMPSVVNTSQVIGVVDKWKEKQIISYLEIDVEDKDECKMALTHLVTTIIQNMKDKEKESRPRRGNPIFSKICGSVSGD